MISRPDPFKDFDPAQTVQVLPRYLAGPGPVGLHTIWPFPFDEGWHLHSSADEGMVFAISPCARLWTRFAPDLEEPGKGTWIIAANRIPFGPRAWGITFDATTPAELLQDVHAELLDLYLESRHSDKDYLFGDDVMAPHEVYTPLLARGWSHSVKTDGTQTFRSPDGLSSVRHRYTIGGSDDLIWRVCGGYASQPYWQARFSHSAPTALAAAFTASLVSTEPLHRTVQDVPFHTRSHLYVATTAAAKQPPTYSPAPPPAPPVAGRTR